MIYRFHNWFSQSRRRPLPTRAFSWLKASTSAFTFKTLLRHYAKQALILVGALSMIVKSLRTFVWSSNKHPLCWAVSVWKDVVIDWGSSLYQIIICNNPSHNNNKLLLTKATSDNFIHNWADLQMLSWCRAACITEPGSKYRLWTCSVIYWLTAPSIKT